MTLIYIVTCFLLFLFNATAPTKIYTLSLHDALPIYQLFRQPRQVKRALRRGRQIIEREVAVGHAVEAVRRWSVEAERSEEHTSELQSRRDIVCRLPLEKKKNAILLWFYCYDNMPSHE